MGQAINTEVYSINLVCLYSNTMVSYYQYCFVVQFNVGESDTSHHFSPSIALVIFGYFLFHINFRTVLLISDKCWCILGGTALHLYNIFGSIAIITILVLPNHEQHIYTHFILSSFIFRHIVLVVFIGVFYFLVKVILLYLIF